MNSFECAWHWSVSYTIHACACARTHARMHARTHARTHAHTHTDYDCSRNWVLILVGMKILCEDEGFQFGFKGWQGLTALLSPSFFSSSSSSVLLLLLFSSSLVWRWPCALDRRDVKIHQLILHLLLLSSSFFVTFFQFFFFCFFQKACND